MMKVFKAKFQSALLVFWIGIGFLFLARRQRECRNFSINHHVRVDRMVICFGRDGHIHKGIRAAQKAYPDLAFRPVDTSFMFMTALWLPEEQVYVAVTRMYMWEEHSVVYMSAFDANWIEISSSKTVAGCSLPSVASIPFNRHGPQWAGPEDPRLIRLHGDGDLYLTVNMRNEQWRRRMFLYRLRDETLMQVNVDGLDLGGSVQKNWLAVSTEDGAFYFVPSLHPFTPMKFDLERSLAQRPLDESAWNSLFVTVPMMRCGSNLVRFTSDFISNAGGGEYYVGFSYYQRGRNFQKSRYRASLMIVHAPSVGGFGNAVPIYYSDPIDFSNAHRDNAEWGMEYGAISYDIVISIITSIVRADWKNDVVEVTMNHNDAVNVVLSVSGLTPFIEQVVLEHQAGYLHGQDALRCGVSFHRQYNRRALGILDWMFPIH